MTSSVSLSAISDDCARPSCEDSNGKIANAARPRATSDSASATVAHSIVGVVAPNTSRQVSWQKPASGPATATRTLCSMARPAARICRKMARRLFRSRSQPLCKEVARSAQYNVWRAISGAPQDVPLALCDARSLAGPELIKADAIFDPPGGAPEFSFEGYVVAHDPGHRWLWFSDLAPDEVIVFKTSESDPERAHCIPHVAFDDPGAPADAPPRVSVEMRATCYWFG